MRFAQINYIYSFWLILGLILFFIWVYRNKKLSLAKFAQQESLIEIAASVNIKGQILKWAMIVTVCALGLLALMRPQWGFQWQEVKRKGLDIIIALDTSKSMLATDVRPTRLERSKLAIKDLIKKLKGDRVGLIAFSGNAFLQCPLTVDYSGFLLALNELDVQTIPQGGTSLSSAIKVAMKSYEGGQKKYKVLIIITDGEDHQGQALRLAQEARKENIKIFCIGIGTAEGDLIQLVDPQGKKTFLKDGQGNIVKTRLNEQLLQKIALSTNGTYLRSSGIEFGLDLIYQEKLSQMEKREIKAQMSKFYYERFQIPLFLALVLLIIEPFLSDKKKR